MELTKDSLEKDSELINAKEKFTENLSFEDKSDFQHGDTGTSGYAKEFKKNEI